MPVAIRSSTRRPPPPRSSPACWGQRSLTIRTCCKSWPVSTACVAWTRGRLKTHSISSAGRTPISTASFCSGPQGNLVVQHRTRSDTIPVAFRIQRCRRSVAQARGTGRLECLDRSRRAGDRPHHAGTGQGSGRGGADRRHRLPAFGGTVGGGRDALRQRRHADRGDRGWHGHRGAGRRSSRQCAGGNDSAAALHERSRNPVLRGSGREGADSRFTPRCRDRHGECW